MGVGVEVAVGVAVGVGVVLPHFDMAIDLAIVAGLQAADGFDIKGVAVGIGSDVAA